MGLLDTNAIQGLFGAAFGPIYGTGRLIRVKKVQRPNGTLVNEYQQPVAIKIQVDRADEAMRQQAGYTETDVKLLILQSGVSGPMLTTDDVIEARGSRWSIYGCGEDPAKSYWRGRGVQQSSDNDAFGWVFEFGHWDDGGRWRVDQDWEGPEAPFTVQPITDWMPIADVQKAILGVIEAVGGETTMMTWQKAMDQLNAIGADHDVDPIAVDEWGATVRIKINTIIEAL